MLINITPKTEMSRYSHTLRFPDLPRRLGNEKGYRIDQAQSGTADQPGVDVKLDDPGNVPASIIVPDTDVSVETQPYDRHETLNATVILHGVVQELSEKHGLKITSAECRGRAGKNALAIRVKLSPPPGTMLRTDLLPEEIDGSELKALPEGAKKRIVINAFERNPRAREQCLKHYGAKCVICGFFSRDVYGDDAEGIIHIHHVKPLREIGREYDVDPVADLCPACPNCHAVLHSRTPIYSIEEVKRLLNLTVAGN